MPIKNYTTTVPASRSVQEIQDALVKHGALGVLYEYEKGTGRIAELRFKLPLGDGTPIGFVLPVDWRKFREVLVNQRVRRAIKDEDFCYRVAWRVIRDWVLAQMALYETQMVELHQIFLPYAITKGGQTLFEQVMGNGNLLGDGTTK